MNAPRLTLPQRIRNKLTPAQRNALLWLYQHGGSGVFMKWPRHMQLMAKGDVSPHDRRTYNKLRDAGLLIPDVNKATAIITPLGIDVAEVIEREGVARPFGGPGPGIQTRAFNPEGFDRVDEGSGP